MKKLAQKIGRKIGIQIIDKVIVPLILKIGIPFSIKFGIPFIEKRVIPPIKKVVMAFIKNVIIPIYKRVVFMRPLDKIMKENVEDKGFNDITFFGEDFNDIAKFPDRCDVEAYTQVDFRIMLLKRVVRALPTLFSIMPYINDDNLHERITHPDAKFWLVVRDAFLERNELGNEFIRNFQGAMYTAGSPKFRKWKTWDTPEFKHFLRSVFNGMAIIANVDPYYRIQGINFTLLLYSFGLGAQQELDKTCKACDHNGRGHIEHFIKVRHEHDLKVLRNFANKTLGDESIEEVQLLPNQTGGAAGVRFKKVIKAEA
jgi:hypothetical protein